MPQVLALEWNGTEARLVVAASRGGRVEIEQAFAVALEPRQPGGDQAEVDVGGRIAAAMAAHRAGRPDTLVAVGRSRVELRQLALPPTPEDELPDIVRFQAMREFNEFDEDWLLDFIPIDAVEEGHQSVLAAAIGPELVTRVRQTCETAGLKLQRLILRPCATASLLARAQAAGPARLILLVDLCPHEAELTVMMGGKVIFLRSARLSGDPLQEGDHRQSLLSEIRRTMAAAQNRLGGQRIESIVLCGRGQEHDALAGAIQEALATPTELFDPFAGLRLSRELHRALPDHPGRFAALLGMVTAELEEGVHAIDFLHPRRRAEPPSRHKKYVLIGLAVALAVALFFGYGWLQRRWLNYKINQLLAESKQLDEEVANAENAKKAVAEIEKWAATDVVWLDEFYELSEKFPPAKDAMLTKLTVLPYAGGREHTPGGEMQLEGLVRDHSTIETIEQALRDEPHRRVEGKDSGADGSVSPYTWQFSSSLYISSKD
jgi:Tfp pilus assembly PilM family ATPase/Tfp pilus assembly protein PilN